MKKNRRSGILIGIGLFCLLAAGGLTAANWMEEKQGDEAARMAVRQLEEEVLPEPKADGSGYQSTARQIQTVVIDGIEYMGVLRIPSLSLELPVIYQWSDQLLKQAPCRYSGSFLQDDMILAGHNYRRHFSGIKQMAYGDEVNFTDVNGTIYQYRVDSLEKISGSDISGMEAGEWDLTLFTCSYGGQDRIAVRCFRVDGIS